MRIALISMQILLLLWIATPDSRRPAAAQEDGRTRVEQGRLTFGTTAVGTTRREGVDVWTFAGQAGQVVVVRMESMLDPVLELVAPDGTLLAENDDFDNLNAQIGPLELPDAGKYTVIAFDRSGGETAYLLTLDEAEAPRPFNGRLTAGRTVTGRLGAGLRDTWTFTARAGQAYVITMGYVDGSLDPYLRLHGPDGEPVAENDDDDRLNAQIGPMVFTVGGAYTITASDATDEGAGTYKLSVKTVDFQAQIAPTLTPQPLLPATSTPTPSPTPAP